MISSFDDIRERAIPILLRDTKDLKKVVVFGSYARGMQTAGSDLDLYVDGRLEYRMDDTKDTEQKVSEALSVPVDLLTRAGLRNSVIRKQLQQSIERDGVVLYG